MKLKLLNVVVLCDDYEKMINWYKDTLELEITLEESEGYHYTELSSDGRCIVGLTPAKEMDHTPTKKRNNSTLLQLDVKGMPQFFEKVKKSEGSIIFGINKDEKYNFLYGSIADPEGNEIWVIEELDK